MKEKVIRAFKTVEDAKNTHILWLKYFKKYPQQEKNFSETIHSAEEQRKIIEDYDNVLDVLNEILIVNPT